MWTTIGIITVLLVIFSIASGIKERRRERKEWEEEYYKKRLGEIEEELKVRNSNK